MASLGAFAIIVNEKNEVLLCHRNDYDLWNLPGGKVEIGESPREAVIREVKEETGYDAEISELLGLYYKPEKDDLVFQFICKIIGGEKTLNDEANKIEYFPIGEIPSNISHKQLERINDYYNGINEVVMKKQLGPGTIDLIKQSKF